MEKCIFSNIHGFHDGGDGLGRDFFAWYRNEISHPVVRLFAFAVSAGFVLTDDNAQPYHVRAVSQYLQRRLCRQTLTQQDMYGAILCIKFHNAQFHSRFITD